MSEPKWTPSEWVEIFPGYEISRSGEVISTGNWRGQGIKVMQQHTNRSGYMRVRLVVDGKRKPFDVHTLVAKTFLGPKPTPAHQVRHLDGNPANNAVENLRWGTTKENAADRKLHGNDSNGWIKGTQDKEAHREACRRSWRLRHGK